MTVRKVTTRCRAILTKHYGAQFKGLVLHGSTVRRRPSAASDIDLLVLLSQPFDYFQELRRIVDLLYPIQLGSDRLISAKPAPADKFERGSIALYRKAKQEGAMVC